jgi:hypothetical protein
VADPEELPPAPERPAADVVGEWWVCFANGRSRGFRAELVPGQFEHEPAIHYFVDDRRVSRGVWDALIALAKISD